MLYQFKMQHVFNASILILRSRETGSWDPIEKFANHYKACDVDTYRRLESLSEMDRKYQPGGTISFEILQSPFPHADQLIGIT